MVEKVRVTWERISTRIIKLPTPTAVPFRMAIVATLSVGNAILLDEAIIAACLLHYTLSETN